VHRRISVIPRASFLYNVRGTLQGDSLVAPDPLLYTCQHTRVLFCAFFVLFCAVETLVCDDSYISAAFYIFTTVDGTKRHASQ